MNTESQALLDAVAANAARDFSEATALPPGIYHDKDVFQLEVERLFYRGWICAGRTAEIPEPGDYICIDVVDEPIIVVRQKDMSVRALPNVCLHRNSRLLDGCGHVSRITCPYHSWTYNVDGQLIGAPFMQRTSGFDTKNFRLQPLPCEVWEGFIYVSLNESAASISTALQGLLPQIEDFRIGDYVHVHDQQEVWNTNWKCLVENFMDVYHLHRVHAETFNKYSSFEEVTEFLHGEDAYCYQYIQEDGGEHSVAAHVDNTWLSEEKRHRTYLFNVYPGQVVQLQPDLLWYLSILPVGTDQVKIRWCVSIPKEILDASDDARAHIAREVDFLKSVNSEDHPTIKRVFDATKSRHAPQGPLSWLEQNVWDFCRYLARELCD